MTHQVRTYIDNFNAPDFGSCCHIFPFNKLAKDPYSIDSE